MVMIIIIHVAPWILVTGGVACITVHGIGEVDRVSVMDIIQVIRKCPVEAIEHFRGKTIGYPPFHAKFRRYIDVVRFARFTVLGSSVGQLSVIHAILIDHYRRRSKSRILTEITYRAIAPIIITRTASGVNITVHIIQTSTYAE